MGETIFQVLQCRAIYYLLPHCIYLIYWHDTKLLYISKAFIIKPKQIHYYGEKPTEQITLVLIYQKRLVLQTNFTFGGYSSSYSLAAKHALTIFPFEILQIPFLRKFSAALLFYLVEYYFLKFDQDQKNMFSFDLYRSRTKTIKTIVFHLLLRYQSSICKHTRSCLVWIYNMCQFQYQLRLSLYIFSFT